MTGLSVEELRKLLNYYPETGAFVWSNLANRNRGILAGCIDKDGYCVIQVNGIQLRASHIAWLFSYGYWPKEELDHKDGKKDNDSIENLREATRMQNNQNKEVRYDNELGVKGVRISRGRYAARISSGGREFYLGSYSTIEEAAEAYKQAAKKYFGEFANG